MMMMMYCYSVGRTERQESTVQSRRNPISKPLRHQSSGKQKVSGPKLSPYQHNVSAKSATERVGGTPATSDGKTDSGTEQSKSRKVDRSIEERLDDVDSDDDDVSDTGEFHSPLAERVKLRRMSHSGDVKADSDLERIDRSKSVQSAADKASSAGMRKSLRSVASSEKMSSNSNGSTHIGLKKWPRAVKSAVAKKKSAIRNAIKLSKTNVSRSPESKKPDVKRSSQNDQPCSSVATRSDVSAANKSTQPMKKMATEKLKPKAAITKSDSVVARTLKEKPAAANAVQPKRTRSTRDQSENRSVEAAAVMPRLKANNKQRATDMREKSMPVLQQEMPLANSSQAAKKSLRKRQQPSPAAVQSKSPKLSHVEETSHSAVKRGSLRNDDAGKEMLSGDDEMPQLSAVELMEKTRPLRVVVDQFDFPPELDRSPLCDVEKICAEERKKSPARCLRDDRDTASKTSPRSVKTAAEHAEDTSKNTTPKHSPARSKHRTDPTPVSTSTELSQNSCNVSSPIAVTQTVCRLSSSQCSKATVMLTEGSEPRQPVAVTCSASSQPCAVPSKPTGTDTGPTAETQPENGYICSLDSTEQSSEVVPYTRPTNSVSGQWQVPCGVPMAPFIITGMYPVMGSSYGCQMMSIPPLVSPAVPAATAVLSGRAGGLPSSSTLQYSSYHLPMSAAAPVVPLYMSPVVGPFMQPGSSSSQVNLVPFMPSLQHATAAVHNQQSSAALVLRPSVLPAEQLYAINCMLPAQQQQVNLSLYASPSVRTSLCSVVIVMFFCKVPIRAACITVALVISLFYCVRDVILRYNELV